MPEFGFIVKNDTCGKRIELRCEHQNGLLYIVPSEASWVCSENLMHAHALSGAFTELIGLDDQRINDILRRWGVYFRVRPLIAQDQPGDPSN